MRTNNNMAGARMLTVALALGLITGSVLTAAPTHPTTLEDRVRHELLGVPYIYVFDNVVFSVQPSGVVTLNGQVTQPYDKSNAEAAVKHAEGVTAVENDIEVLPPSPFDDRIRIQTLRSLEHLGTIGRYFAGPQPLIRIIVKNGNVTLEGTVLNSADRQIAYMAANRVPGVFSVTNNLQTER